MINKSQIGVYFMNGTFMNQFIDEITKFIKKSLDEKNIPGISIAIIDKSGIIWSEGFGYTDWSKTKKVNPKTLFWIGSLSKAYTATAFFRAVQKGLVNLDDPIRKFYPEFSINTTFDLKELDKITFRHLLAHRAGLQHFTLQSDFEGYPLYSFEKYIASINKSWQKYPVGENHSYSYSNAGYDLVAYILQRITGKKFDVWMKDEVYEPLGMKSSVVGTQNVLGYHNWARGHYGDRQFNSELLISPNLGSAAQYSSVHEMANFIKMHLNNGYVGEEPFLTEESLNEIYSIPFPEEHQLVTIGYGIGVIKNKFGGELLLSFMGDGDGCFALHQFYPKLGLGLLVESNDITSTFPVLLELSNMVFSKLLEEKFGKMPDNLTINEKIKLPPVITIDNSHLKRLAGNYISRMMNIVIEFKNNELCFDLQGKDIILKPHSKTIFSSEETPKVVFILNDKEQPIKVKVLTSEGRVLIFDYDNGSEDELGPDKESWKQYLGYYRSTYVDMFPLYTTFYVKNGYLTQFTTIGNQEFKLEERAEGLFFTVDGQNVEFKDEQLFTPANIWHKIEPSVEEIKHLLSIEPDNILVSKIGLEELMTILEKTEKNEAALEIKKLIEENYQDL